MAEDITEILSKAEVIRDETGESKNTAKRVGGVLVDICNAFKRVTDAVAGYLTVSKRVDRTEVLIRRQQDGEDVDRNTFEMTYDPSDGTVDIDAPEVCVRGKEIATLEDIEEKEYIDPASLWALLRYPSDEQIGKSHISDALSGYAKSTDVPTKTSDLINDSGYLTSHQSLANYVDKTTEQTISGIKNFKELRLTYGGMTPSSWSGQVGRWVSPNTNPYGCISMQLGDYGGSNANTGFYLFDNAWSKILFSVLNNGNASFSGDISEAGTKLAEKYLGKTATASSATKLANSRTLWGQSFDGSGDVSGAISRAESVGRDGNNMIDFANTQSNKAYGGVWTWTRGADNYLIAYLDNNGLLLKRPWLRLQDRVTYIDREALYYNDGKLYLNGSNAYIDLNGNQTLQGGLKMNGTLSGARGEIKGITQLVDDTLTVTKGSGALYPTASQAIGAKDVVLYRFRAYAVELCSIVLQGYKTAVTINLTTTDTEYCFVCISAHTNTPSDVPYTLYSSNSISKTIYKHQLINLTEMFGQGNEPTTATEFANRLGYASIEDVPYIPYGTIELNNAVAFGGGAMFGGNIATTGDTFKLGKYTIKEQDGHLIATDGTNTTTIL